MMSTERYTRILNKIFPCDDGNERFRAARKCGFRPPQHNNLSSGDNNVEFRVAYIEFIRYHITPMEFYML